HCALPSFPTRRSSDLAAGIERIQVIDSHTGGEPTRVVVAGGPDLGDGTLAQRRAAFRDRFDDLRSAIVNEPRGSDVMVGALLCRSEEHTSELQSRGHL